MPSIKIEGVPPYDGTYPLEMDMTMREWHTIKQVSGVLPGTFEQSVRDGDLDLAIALAVNALRRAGHTVNMDALWEATAGRIMVIADEGDADPPPQPDSPSGEKPSEPSGSSGESSSTTGDQLESGQSPTGTQP